MHRSIYFYTALAAFLVGVAIGSYVGIPGATLWAVFLGAGICMLFFSPRMVLVGIVLCAAAVGIQRVHAARVDDTELYVLAQQKADATIIGYIDGDWKRSESWWSVPVRAVIVDGGAVDERVLVRVSDEPRWRFGDGVRVSGRLGRVAAFDGFDYPAYLRKEGIRAVMIRPQMADAAPELSTRRRIWVTAVRNIYGVRDTFASSVRRAVPEPEASYLVGILVGGRAALPQSIVDDFSRTSTSHVLAISGYNITILGAAVMVALTRALGRRKAMFVTLGVISIFVIMTGASASVVRAALMGMLVLIAAAFGRQIHVGRVILFSAACMVWYNPLILRDDIGFQLSFVALAGLVYLSPIIEARVGAWGKGWLGRIVIATTAAQIAVLPLIVYYFHTLSVLGPVVNVLILPVVPISMALGFTTGIVGLAFAPIARGIGLLAWGVGKYQLGVVSQFAALPWSAAQVMINANIVIASYGLLLLWWSLEKKQDLAYDTIHARTNISPFEA